MQETEWIAMRVLLYRSIAGLMLAAAWGQTAPATALTFEVATIRPAPPITPEQIRARTAHIGMTVDGTRVDIGSASLTGLIMQAYQVKTYQVAGPDWLTGYRQNYDILAKMPEGATRDRVPEMLRALLAERFKLAVHRESREHPVYALMAGKNGTKLKQAPPDSEPAIKTSMNPDGTVHSQMTGTMALFADFLTPYVDRPVMDMTEMKGPFEIGFDITRQPRTDPAFETEFFAAVDRLGLKLDPRKLPVETIVVDHMEKTPTEN
jgi:uncharacterized protein (TIGR03435 family)